MATNKVITEVVTASCLAFTLVACYELMLTAHKAQVLMYNAAATAYTANASAKRIDNVLKGDPSKGDPGLLTRVSLLVANADSAINQLKQTMQTVNKVSKANADKTTQLTNASIEAVYAGTASLVKLTATVNELDGLVGDVRGLTLPKVNASIDALNADVSGMQPIEAHASELLSSGNAVMLGLQATTKTANDLLSNPNLTAVAANLNLTSQYGASALKHIDTATGYIEYDLSPKHMPLWQSLISGALSQAIGIPLKIMPSRVSVTSSVPIKTQ